MLSYSDSAAEQKKQYHDCEQPTQKDAAAQKLYEIAMARGFEIERLQKAIVDALRADPEARTEILTTKVLDFLEKLQSQSEGLR